MKILDAISIRKLFDGNDILNEISLSLEEKQCLGIIGINGAGKSTFIKIVMGLERFDAGTLVIFGNKIELHKGNHRLPSSIAKRIGYVPQKPAFDEDRSAWDNLEFHGRLFRLEASVIHSRIRDVLLIVELVQYADLDVGKFSGGMQKRLAIARALLTQPDFLILDEPTANLDPVSRQNIWHVIQRLKYDLGCSILLSTNNMHEAESLCDSVFMLVGGKIVSKGNPQDMISSMGMKVFDITLSRTDSLNEIEEVINRVIQDQGSYFNDYKHIKIYLAKQSMVEEKLIHDLLSLEGQIENISVHEPTLDDYFLKHYGYSLEGVETLTLYQLKQLFEATGDD